MVRDALALTENQMKGEGVVLVTELAAQPVRVKADPGHSSQVVLALVSNARTAMLKSSRKVLTVRTGERDGRGFLEVEDTGKGIAPEHLHRIFEPFFTTKDVWSNVGLGPLGGLPRGERGRGHHRREDRGGQGLLFHRVAAEGLSHAPG